MSAEDGESRNHYFFLELGEFIQAKNSQLVTSTTGISNQHFAVCKVPSWSRLGLSGSLQVPLDGGGRATLSLREGEPPSVPTPLPHYSNKSTEVD